MTDDGEKRGPPPIVRDENDESEYAVPSGSPDVYDPSYVPPDAALGPSSTGGIHDPAASPQDSDAAAVGPSGVVVTAETRVGAALRPPGGPVIAARVPTAGVTEAARVGAALGAAGVAGLGSPDVVADASASSGIAAPYPPSPSSGVALGALPAPSLSPDDAPILPPELTAQAALADAVGAPSKKARKRARSLERDQERDPSEPTRSRRTPVVAGGAIVGGLGIATLVLLGHANSQRFEITCDATHVYAEQGRSFPPWGSKKLYGPAWAPITLPANAECQTRATENEAELTTWYLALLVDRATTTLTARDLLETPMTDASGKATNQLDYVSTQLDQALLLARDPDKRDQRKEITRLQGDVDYWRAAARVRDASTVLLDATKQFDVANQKRPRHATDAAAWSTFLHRVADELRAGPNGAPVMTPASGAEPVGAAPVPVGTALPVEPSGSAGSADTPPSAPSVPSGGVLL